MKKAIWTFALLLAVPFPAGAQGIAATSVDLHFGGGFFWDAGPSDWPSGMTPNLHMSVNLPGAGPLSLAPFYEYIEKRGNAASFYGLNVRARLPFSTDNTELYFGPGVGLARSNGGLVFRLFDFKEKSG